MMRTIANIVSGYVHTAPFSFLSVFVDEDDARSRCSLMPSQNKAFFLVAVKKTPVASFNAIALNSLSTNVSETFSTMSPLF